MIQLLFSLLFVEGSLILLLMAKTPFRKLTILGLDRLKRGRGPVTVKTIAATVFTVMVSSLYSIAKIQKRSFEAGLVTPTDQVLLIRNLLEASLMGYSLFLALIIDRLHHYVRELRNLRRGTEAAKRRNGGYEDGKGAEAVKNRNGGYEDGKGVVSDKNKEIEDEISGLRGRISQLESMLASMEKEVNAAEADAAALKKQSNDLLLECNRLQEENRNIRCQLQSC